MKQKINCNPIFFIMTLLFSFCFLHLITANFIFMITLEELQGIVQKSAIFLAIPAIIPPISLALSRKLKRLAIVLFVNSAVVVTGLLISNNTFSSGFDYAVYSAFSAVACLVFVLEFIIPKIGELHTPKICVVIQLAFGVSFIGASIAFDFINTLNPQIHSSPLAFSLILLCGAALVTPIHLFINKKSEKAVKSLLFSLPAIALYLALMLLHNNANLPLWNYRLIFTSGLICVFSLYGYHFHELRIKAKSASTKSLNGRLSQG